MLGRFDGQQDLSRESQFAERVNNLGFKPPARPYDFMQLCGIVEQSGLAADPCGPNREQFELAYVAKKFPVSLMRLAAFIIEQALLPPAYLW